MVADINRQTGESECQYYKDRLLYSEDGQRDGLIQRSRTLSCHGELKNNRGMVSRPPGLLSFNTTTDLHDPPPHNRPSCSSFLSVQKLHVFLFQDVLVITRSVSFSDQPLSYQLWRQPIPIRQLDLEDLLDGEMRVGGSIRGAFSNSERSQSLSHNASI